MGFAVGATVALSVERGAWPLGHPAVAAAFELWSGIAGLRGGMHASAAKRPASTRAGRRTVGLAAVVDGDTVDLNTGLRRVRVRLRAVHAPELPTKEGIAARDALRRLAAKGPFTCIATGARTHGRIVADCRTISGADVATALIRAGVASHCERYGRPELARLAQPRRIWNARPAYCRTAHHAKARSPGARLTPRGGS